MQNIKENIMIDIKKDISLKKHFNNVWSSSKSHWKYLKYFTNKKVLHIYKHILIFERSGSE